MTRSKVKVAEVQKLQKWPISKPIFSANVYVIKRLMVNCDLQDIDKFSLDIFLIFVLV